MTRTKIIEQFISGENCCVCGEKFLETDPIYEIPCIEEYFYDKSWGTKNKTIFAHQDCMYLAGKRGLN